ncbi:cyanophycinase [Peribacillus deserti]|uniref:Cyanophycinase n=1 Tax=Peribacillus deserti TaxID=673318 RepID=A0ABS2QFC1_9BACI|nr:Type 1 glutamine amidotransferase-like domain-containing protein [Peribacillus deserti]MBM7691399.1 cyanophycinase [Peribacillus deserti]
MNDRHLFLHGGSPPFLEKMGRRFAGLVSKIGKTAILFIERDGWQDYMNRYTAVLKENGIHHYIYIPLHISPEEIVSNLSECTGIIIGGGDTERYQKYIVGTEVGKCIQAMYQNGVPVAGFSAGALISPSICVIPPIDNKKNVHLFLDGLGLLNDCVVSVHFSKWNEEENLKTAVMKTNATIGFGLDDGTCAYFINEKLSFEEGKKVYRYTANNVESTT